MSTPGSPRWTGHGPWDEVWFLEGVDASGAGFWFRLTLTDGVVPRVETWAAWDGARRHVGHATHPLPDLRVGSTPWASCGDAWLDGTRFRGRAGTVAWDLHLDGTVPTQPLVPTLLERLGVGRTYEPVLPACRVRGRVELPDGPVEVSGRGVLGHLFGGRSRVASWGWFHVPGFPDAPDVVFEALSARLGPGPGLPPLTACTLRIGDVVHAHNTLDALVRTRARLSERAWTLRASRRDHQITATVRLPDDVVLAEYTAPDDRRTWCHNSSHVQVDLTLTEGGTTRRWRTTRALGELASRSRPRRRPDLP